MKLASFSLLITACLASYSVSVLAADGPSDAQIAQIMMTANNAEITAAKTALAKSKNKDVREFAEHMIKEHSKNNGEGKKLDQSLSLKPEESATSKDVQTDADSKVTVLKTLSGQELDSKYIAQQIDMHAQLLKDLDQTFIPAAQSPKLKSFLEDTKTHVQKHLAMAKKIQDSLTKQ